MNDTSQWFIEQVHAHDPLFLFVFGALVLCVALVLRVLFRAIFGRRSSPGSGERCRDSPAPRGGGGDSRGGGRRYRGGR